MVGSFLSLAKVKQNCGQYYGRQFTIVFKSREHLITTRLIINAKEKVRRKCVESGELRSIV